MLSSQPYPTLHDARMAQWGWKRAGQQPCSARIYKRVVRADCTWVSVYVLIVRGTPDVPTG